MASAGSVGTLHFVSGKLASGKTTLARRIARQQHAVVISEDIWLSRLYPDATFDLPTYLRLSSQLRSALAPHVVDLLRHGASVVFDFAGNTPRHRAWVRSIFEAAEARHVLHHIDASDELCKVRLRRRNSERPEGSQHTTDEEFDAITAYFVPPAATEGFNLQEYRADDADVG